VAGLKNKDKYLKIEDHNEIDGFKIRNAKFPELEESIALWHNKCMNKNVPFTDIIQRLFWAFMWYYKFSN